MEVELTAPEFHSAVQVALLRLVTSSLRGMNHASTYDRTWLKRLEEEVIGACGERAVCKAAGIHWDASVDTFHRVPDAGARMEIRATRLDDGSLIIRENDADDRWYYLVTGEPPRLTIRGRIRGGAAKRDEWLRNPHGHRRAWFVPISALTPVGPLATVA